MPVVTNIEDLRQLAKKRVAKAVFEYVDRGAYDEATLRANRADLDALKFRQRVGIDVEPRSTRSTMSICPIKDSASALSRPFWFQLYVMRDRGFSASLIDRAKQAKCAALVLTLDLQIQGQPHRDLKNGLVVPPRLTFGTF